MRRVIKQRQLHKRDGDANEADRLQVVKMAREKGEACELRIIGQFFGFRFGFRKEADHGHRADY